MRVEEGRRVCIEIRFNREFPRFGKVIRVDVEDRF